MLAIAIIPQCLQTIARRNAQVIQDAGLIEQTQLSQG